MKFDQKSLLVQNSAKIAIVLFGLVIFIQLLLAAGVLPVTMAWGGTQKVLTPELRFASLFSAVLLSLFAYIIKSRADNTRKKSPFWLKALAWIVTLFMAFNVFTNSMSESTVEMLIFIPISFALTIVCFIVSTSKTSDRAEL